MTTHLPPLATPALSDIASFDPHGAQEANAVCLWLLDINQLTGAHYAEAERIMNHSERERAQNFIRGKEAYIASRWLLRKVLAHYIDCAPEAVELLRSNKGKPFLAHNSNIQFNLSHSGRWALLAVGDALLIGVDIEEVRTTRDLPGIAESYYHRNEFTLMQRLDAAAQADYFYRLWTLKEAFFKATGSGISAGLDKIEFTLTANISANIASELDAGSTYWQFQQWGLGACDYCALAYKDPRNLDIRWFDALAMPAFP